MSIQCELMVISKDNISKLGNLRLKDLTRGDTDDSYTSIYDLLKSDIKYNMGDMVNDTDERIIINSKDVFVDKDVKEYFSDYTVRDIGKQGLIRAIEVYRDKVYRDYQRILAICQDETDDSRIETLSREIKHKLGSWAKDCIVNVADNSVMTHCGLYEYAIFNLLLILKTVNWDKDTIVCLVG